MADLALPGLAVGALGANVLPKQSGCVAPRNAARAPRLSMIPVEELMAQFAHQAVAGELTPFRATINTLLRRLAGADNNPFSAHAYANATMNEAYFKSQGLKLAAATLVQYNRLGPGNMGPPGREVQLVRTLLPQLQQDFINIQTEQKAYCDFAMLAQVREAIDDLQNDLEQHDLDDVVHTTLMKREDLRNLAAHEMSTHKYHWGQAIRGFEAKMDNKESRVLDKYCRMENKLDSDASAGTVSLGFTKKPKLPPRAIEIKAQLERFAGLKTNDPASFRKAEVLRAEFAKFELAAQADFDKYQQGNLDKMREKVHKERDGELMKIQKKRIDGLQRTSEALMDEAKASKQRYRNCLHRIEHDHCMALQKNVRKGIRPKRPQVMLTPDPKFSTMPELERDGSHLGATPSGFTEGSLPSIWAHLGPMSRQGSNRPLTTQTGFPGTPSSGWRPPTHGARWTPGPKHSPLFPAGGLAFPPPGTARGQSRSNLGTARTPFNPSLVAA